MITLQPKLQIWRYQYSNHFNVVTFTYILSLCTINLNDLIANSCHIQCNISIWTNTLFLVIKEKKYSLACVLAKQTHIFPNHAQVSL